MFVALSIALLAVAPSAQGEGGMSTGRIDSDVVSVQPAAFNNAFVWPPIDPYLYEDAAFCGPTANCQLGTVASRYGVIVFDRCSPQLVVPRAGAIGMFGSHTLGGMGEAGFAGGVPLGGGHMATYNVVGHLGANQKQWSYGFAGIEAHLGVEVGLDLHLGENHYLGAGWRLDWFDNESFDQLDDKPLTAQNNHSILDQRLGTVFVQYDVATVTRFHRLRIEFGNDSVLGGDGRDEFRTHQSRVLYLSQSGPVQIRVGALLELFTGEVDTSKVDFRSDGAFYDTSGLAFADRSMGFLGLELGASWFQSFARCNAEIGFNVVLGADTESIRDTFQNEMVHKGILGIPQVPRLNRADRLRLDAVVFVILHFG